MKQITNNIIKVIWNIVSILWSPFEVIYIMFSATSNTFKVSKIGSFIAEKLYEANNKQNNP